MRGNHDCFNTGANFSETEFARMSQSKTEGYAFLHQKEFGVYAFLAIDLCPAVGTSRPFNFFGTMSTHDLDALSAFISSAQLHHHNHTFVLTHYPNAVTVSGRSSKGETLRSLSPFVSLWLSGHLHQLILGIGATMYAHHAHGAVELELGDMKDHGVYRVVAVDGDMVSFADEVVGGVGIPMHAPDGLGRVEEIPGKVPPVVLVTNPRDARFALEGREPVGRIRQSTHVRMLIYASAGVNASGVRAVVDGTKELTAWVYAGQSQAWKGLTDENEANHLPLWVHEWDAAVYDDESDHMLEVEVVDVEGGRCKKRILFRVDGTRTDRGGMGKASGTFVLKIRFAEVFQSLFIFAHVFIVVPLLLIPFFYLTHHRISGTLPIIRSSIIARTRQLCHQLSLPRGSRSPSRRTFPGDDDIDDEDDDAGETRPRGVLAAVSARIEQVVWGLVYSLLALADTPRLWIPLYGLAMWSAVGFWFVGDFVDSQKGVVVNRFGLLFTQGIWFPGSGGMGWIPMSDTFFY
ncbi:Transmembrane protein 62, partial [Irineochytrium annulatum]